MANKTCSEFGQNKTQQEMWKVTVFLGIPSI